MSHWPANWQDIIYRLHLLRRLTLVCAALLWAGMLAGSALGGGAMPWDAAPLPWAVAALALVALHNVLFPGGWLDILAGSVAGGAVLAGSYVFAGMFHLQPVMVTMLLLVVWFVSVMVLMVLIASCSGIGIRMRDLRQEAHLAVSAGALRRVMFIHPDQRDADHYTGPADENGFFPVSFGFVFPDLKTFELPEPQAMPKPDCFVRIVEEGPDFQLTQWLMADPEGQMAERGSVAHITIREDGPDACHLIEAERHDAWDYLTLLSGWLVDQRRDYLREKVDKALGRATVAARALPQVTVMSLIARQFVRWRLAPGAGQLH